ncbi:Membrane protein insertase YidC [Thalassoglobus neptunius]|uniref:Membrane protein insertase YidC n=1 Tax=Thalassoglobus neptunius TaxID=1938619 RepID=A0A5C5X1F2_9PLAN|nr:membrane protein insertase YidC [Thalassoglobus neptunius]TWT56964.1 Membrane protein insertase YidC [Thalassoglobus neptunius]
MDQRRYMFFVILTMIFFLVWSKVAPQLFPGMFPPPQKQVEEQVDPEADDNAPLANSDPAESDEEPESVDEDPSPEDDESKPSLTEFPNKLVTLGEEGFDAGYLIQAQVNSRGGAVDWVILTDPRYTSLNRKEQLKVIGNPISGGLDERVPNSFEMSVAQIDSQLAEYKTSLNEVEWEVVEQTPESVTLRYPAPDGSFEVVKTYRISKAELELRDESPTGYMLNMDVVLRNLKDKSLETAYSLQGPVGVPLENVDNTRSFREIDIATIDDPNDPTDFTSIHLQAQEIVKQFDRAREGGKPVTAWRLPIHYAGLDVQFFAALVFPERGDEGTAVQWFDSVEPQLLVEAEKPERSDFSFMMNSRKQTVPAGGEVKHTFDVFFGPKRTQLLKPLGAEEVVRLGWFSPIAKLMLGVLGFFHNWVGLPYAFAIILLTVMVRGLMFPISKKQAIESEKMKVLAPKLKELQDKHKDKPEEFAKAYRAFQKKHDYHPLFGCLPALLQLPIFWGLYTSLYQAVDLRLARFLWIDNLAAPDALFQLGFTVPWLGYTEFNLLPILTVILFIVQQKMFTPPPTSEEQAMTYKMMNFMMIAIGFAFYRVPAGLCLYFISSSLWGICERLLLKNQKGPDVDTEELSGPVKPEIVDKPDREPGFFEKLRIAADEAQGNAQRNASGRKYSKKNKNRKR